MLTLEAWVDIKSMHRQGRSIRSIATRILHVVPEV